MIIVYCLFLLTVHYVLMIMYIIFTFFLRLCLFYFIHVYSLSNLVSFSTFAVIYPMEHPTGFQSSPAECFPKRVTCEALLSYFRYIGWKLGCKLCRGIRMDGNAVCTRDTTPRTKMGLKCGSVLLPCLINFLLFGLFCYCSFLYIILFITI